ncbi:MAG: pyridoxal 5'-phosphate synthase glutaminase subunit PdxT [Chloroflexi bacterium]|nr:pyridoxal 5'-phosphate synthase glutaminase subunit PdxT [Chloroflexota bacterium]
MKLGVLALQGDFAEHGSALRRLDVEVVEVRLPRHLEGLSGLIIPGGESTTISRLLREYGLLAPIRERVQRGMPLMGTCAGAIVMAKTAIGLHQENLGLMDITVRRNAFGRQVDSFEADLEIPALGAPPLHAVFIRAPTIETVQPGVEVLARLADGTVVAARQGHLLALVFHPELTADPRFHAYFLRMAEQATTPGQEPVVAAGSGDPSRP